MRRVVLAIATLCLFGCATYGNQALKDPETVAQVKPGQNKAEVLTIVGKPMNVVFLSENTEAWYYTCSSYQTSPATFIPIIGLFAGGGNMQTQTLTLFFEGDILKKVGAGEQTGVVGPGAGYPAPEPAAYNQTQGQYAPYTN